MFQMNLLYSSSEEEKYKPIEIDKDAPRRSIVPATTTRLLASRLPPPPQEIVDLDDEEELPPLSPKRAYLRHLFFAFVFFPEVSRMPHLRLVSLKARGKQRQRIPNSSLKSAVDLTVLESDSGSDSCLVLSDSESSVINLQSHRKDFSHAPSSSSSSSSSGRRAKRRRTSSSSSSFKPEIQRHDIHDILSKVLALGVEINKAKECIDRLSTQGTVSLTAEVVLETLFAEEEDSQQVMCEICCDDQPKSSMVSCSQSPSPHSYCRECVSRYLRENPKQEHGGPVCPSAALGCKGVFLGRVLRRSGIDADILEEVERTMLSKVAVGKGFVECPKCHMSSFQEEIDSNPVHQCPYENCGNIFCSTCGDTVQTGQTDKHVCKAKLDEVLVDDHHKDKSDDEKIKIFQREVESLLSASDLVPCPKCQRLIEKLDGCNSVKCGGCGCHMCWQCGKDTVVAHGAHECASVMTIDPSLLRKQQRLDDIVKKLQGRRELGWLESMQKRKATAKVFKELRFDLKGNGVAELEKSAPATMAGPFGLFPLGRFPNLANLIGQFRAVPHMVAETGQKRRGSKRRRFRG